MLKTTFTQNNKSYIDWLHMLSRLIKIAFICLLIALTVHHYRHLFTYFAPLMIDYIKFYSATHAIAQGMDPYEIQNLVYTNSVLVPFIFPGMVLPMIPFVWMNLQTSGYVFMLVNMLISPWMLYYAGKKLQIPFSWRLLDPDRNTLITCMAFYLFLNSYPALGAISAGQLSILVSLFLVFSLFATDCLAAFHLALAMALKYSLAPPVAIAYFIKQHYLKCVYTVLFFLLFAISPLLFGFNLVQLYSKYIWGFTTYVTAGGFDSFQHHGYMLLNFDFFKMPLINLSGKIVVVALLLVTFYYEMKRPRIDLKWLLLLSSATMFLSYHRAYDLVFSMLLLTLLAVYCYHVGMRWHSVILFLFLAFLAIPDHVLRMTFSALGSAIGENRWIYLAAWLPVDVNSGKHVLGETDILPFHAIYNALLTGYAFWVYFFSPDWLLIPEKQNTPQQQITT